MKEDLTVDDGGAMEQLGRKMLQDQIEMVQAKAAAESALKRHLMRDKEPPRLAELKPLCAVEDVNTDKWEDHETARHRHVMDHEAHMKHHGIKLTDGVYALVRVRRLDREVSSALRRALQECAPTEAMQIAGARVVNQEFDLSEKEASHLAGAVFVAMMAEGLEPEPIQESDPS